MEILVGLDASPASKSICALGANGKTVNEAKVPPDPESPVEHLRELPGEIAAPGKNAPLAAECCEVCRVEGEAALGTFGRLTGTQRLGIGESATIAHALSMGLAKNG